MPDTSPAICWLRNDLRLRDNPALQRAIETGKPVIVLYIREIISTDDRREMGGAAKWWLDKSLQSLKRSLVARGADLVLRTGDAITVLGALARDTGANSIFWNRRYRETEREEDARIKDHLRNEGYTAESCHGTLLA